MLVTDESKKHILIVHRGNFYSFPVLDDDGKIIDPEEIYACIQHILNSNAKEPEFPLGVLTSEDRNVWADVRAKLEALGNKEALNVIDTALYCIALDDLDSDDHEALSHNFLHGPSQNR